MFNVATPAEFILLININITLEHMKQEIARK